MSRVLLSAEGVSKTLTGDIPVTLVKGANVTIQTAEFVSVTGPSGSGKSSLLYLLGLLDHPTAGRIVINGQDTKGMSDDDLAKLRLSNIGFIFQFHFLLPEFTSLENVMIPMRRLGRLGDTEIRLKAEKILFDLGLESQKDKLPKQMSGGQCQRVAIARALANDAPLILADEPTGNLDTVSSKTVQDILRNLTRGTERAVVAVTHDMDFAATADRTIRIVDGVVQ
jgi:lipoprotein-releasing system ATP-binding protein